MKRKTAIPKRLPRPTPPDAVEREYYRNLRKYADRYNQLVRFALKDVVPDLKEVAASEQPKVTRVRLDAFNVSRMDVNIEKRIADLLDWVNQELSLSFSDKLLRSWAKSMIDHSSTMSKKNILKVADSVGLEVEPLLHDRDMNPYFLNVVDENVGLIKSIPAMHQTAFKNALVYALTNDMPRTQIEDIIKNHIGKSGNVKNRARLIATDQVGKLNAILNEHRQRQLGGKRYVWRTSKDERVTGKPGGKYPKAKPSHWAREGKIFSWDKPPEGGHPGQRVRCRCHAEMVMEDVLE